MIDMCSEACMLLMNDLHISKDDIPEFVLNWKEALDVCESNRVNLIVLGGDLFQSRASQTLDVLLSVGDSLREAEERGIKVVLANGNHDKVNLESVKGYCHVFEEHPNVRVVDCFQTLKNEKWDFVFHIIPYFPENDCFMEHFKDIRYYNYSDDKMNFLYLHAGISGALSTPNERELPANIFYEFDKVFVGHYHNRCKVKGTEIEYIGSSRQHNFGEDEEKGYTLVYTNGETEFVKNKVNTRYKVMDVKAEDLNIHLTDELSEIKENGKYKVKVCVLSNSNNAKSIDKKVLLDAGANKVEIITEDMEVNEVVSTSLFEKFDSKQITANYLEFCKDIDVSDTKTGLFYLNKTEGAICGN